MVKIDVGLNQRFGTGARATDNTVISNLWSQPTTIFPYSPLSKSSVAISSVSRDGHAAKNITFVDFRSKMNFLLHN